MKKIGREPRKVATIIDGALRALDQQAISVDRCVENVWVGEWVWVLVRVGGWVK